MILQRFVREYPIIIEEPSLTIKIRTTSTTSSGGYSLSDTINYLITVTNSGTETLGLVIIGDYVNGDQWGTISNFPSGQTTTFTTERIVTENDILNGSITETVTATEETYELEVTDTVTSLVETPNPEITVTLTSNKSNYSLGETVTYTIVITNTGNLTINNIGVSAELTTDEWLIDSLAPGVSIQRITSYVIRESDVLRGTVTETVTGFGSNSSNISTNVISGNNTVEVQ